MGRILQRTGLALGGLALLGGGVVFGWLPGWAERQRNRVAEAPGGEPSEAARQLHRRLFVADLHNDLLMWDRDPLERASRGHTDLPRLLEGGVALEVFSTVSQVPKTLSYERNRPEPDLLTPLVIAQAWPPRTWTSPFERTLYQASKLQRAAERSGGRLLPIRWREDLDELTARRARGEAVLGGVLSVEGLHALEGRLAAIDRLHGAGFRMMGLAHFFDNRAAGSAHGVDKGGLTPFGRRAVERMEALGIAVDLAHASPAAFRDTTDMATRPVVVSHTGVQGTCPGRRNLSDAQLERVAATGGVVGIGLWPGAVCGTGPTDVVRAIRYAADRIGVEHVALGSDFDGATTVGLDATGLPRITEALLEAGFGEGEIAAILGANARRLLERTLPPRP